MKKFILFLLAAFSCLFILIKKMVGASRGHLF